MSEIRTEMRDEEPAGEEFGIEDYANLPDDMKLSYLESQATAQQREGNAGMLPKNKEEVDLIAKRNEEIRRLRKLIKGQ